MGGFVPPPHMVGDKCRGDKVLMGGLMRGDIDLMGGPNFDRLYHGGTHEEGHRPYGGPNFDRLYHKLKVLLLLSCNYMMQFVGYDSIKPR